MLAEVTGGTGALNPPVAPEVNCENGATVGTRLVGTYTVAAAGTPPIASWMRVPCGRIPGQHRWRG